MSTLKVGTIQDTSAGSSSTPAQIMNGRAKAWVKWNGTGTLAVNASFNISGVTDLGTGYYKVNFDTDFADTSYTAMFQGDTAVTPGTGHAEPYIADYDGSAGDSNNPMKAGYTSVIWHQWNNGGTRVDSALSSGVFFR